MVEGVNGVVEFAFLKVDCAEIGVDFGQVGIELCEFEIRCFRLVETACGHRLLGLLGQQLFAGLRSAIRLSSQRSGGGSEDGKRDQIRE